MHMGNAATSSFGSQAFWPSLGVLFIWLLALESISFGFWHALVASAR
jgi:uncharacterized membrane protein